MTADVDNADPRHEVGEAGGPHECSGSDTRDWHVGLTMIRIPGFSSGLEEPVCRGVLISLEGAVENDDATEPLHVGHAVPTRSDEAHGSAMLRRKWLPVHLIGEEQVTVEGVLD